MQMPVDIKAIIDEATDYEQASHTPVAVSLIIDPTAPADLIAYARSAFTSDVETLKLTIAYLDRTRAQGIDALFGADAPVPAGVAHYVDADDDLIALVAGESAAVSQVVDAARKAGVPMMLITLSPRGLAARLEEAGCTVDGLDIVSPVELTRNPADLRSALNTVANYGSQAVGMGAAWLGSAVAPVRGVCDKVMNAALSVQQAVSDDGVAGGDGATDAAGVSAAAGQGDLAEPIALDDAAKDCLAKRMGQWVIAARSSKKLALALAFPFVRKPCALEAVSATSVQNAGIGLVPFIKGADMPIMTLNQAKMVLQIAAAYGQPMGLDRAKEIVAVVGGAFACRAVAREAVGLVPVLGGPIRAGVGYGGTVAMGRAVIEYFEGGENLAGVAQVADKIKDAGLDALSKVADKAAQK